MPEAKKSGIGKFLLPAIILAGKAGKMVKLLKFGKLFLTFGTMMLSVLAYSFSWGWQFALGFVVMLFIHEMGHVIALRMKGMKASAPVFIPFLGALIFAPSMGSKEDEAFVGYGGPLLGTIGALALLPIWALMPSHPPALMTLSFVALFLNIFNMVPVRPFDGGRITQVIGGWFKYFGVLAVAGIVLYLRDPGLLILVMLILLDWEGMRRLVCSVAVIGCWLAMISLYAAGLGSGNNASMIIDIPLGFLFSLGPMMHLRRLYLANRDWRKARSIGISELELAVVPAFDERYNWGMPEASRWWDARNAYIEYQFRLNGRNHEGKVDFADRLESEHLDQKPKSSEPVIPWKTRIKWLVLYLGLSALIIGVMVWESGHLSQIIGKK